MKKILLLLCIILVGSTVYGQALDYPCENMDNIEDIHNRIKKLKTELRQAKREFKKQEEAYADKLVKCGEITNIRAKIDSLDSIAKLLTEEIELKKKGLVKLVEKQNQYINNMIQHHQSYIEKPLSKIDTKLLSNIHEELQQYRDVAYEKEALDGAISKVTTLQGYIETYNNAKQTLNVQFDKAEVDKYIDELSTCSANTILNASQQGEIENTITLLKKYEIGVDVLIYVVDYIRNRVKSTYSHNEFNFDYGRALDRIVKDTDTLAIKHGLAAKKIGELFEEYVTPIPHLKNLFNSFKKDITKNPTEQTKTEIELDGYKE